MKIPSRLYSLKDLLEYFKQNVELVPHIISELARKELGSKAWIMSSPRVTLFRMFGTLLSTSTSLTDLTWINSFWHIWFLILKLCNIFYQYYF